MVKKRIHLVGLAAGKYSKYFEAKGFDVSYSFDVYEANNVLIKNKYDILLVENFFNHLSRYFVDFLNEYKTSLPIIILPDTYSRQAINKFPGVLILKDKNPETVFENVVETLRKTDLIRKRIAVEKLSKSKKIEKIVEVKHLFGKREIKPRLK